MKAAYTTNVFKMRGLKSAATVRVLIAQAKACGYRVCIQSM